MSSKKINVVIERGIDGSFSAYIADDNCEFGCIGEGKSVEETKADFMKAVGEMQEVYAEEDSVSATYRKIFQCSSGNEGVAGRRSRSSFP